jgi:site-specific DNA recombinase
MTKRAVLYARVCVDDGQNLAEQLETCRQYARQHDWHVVEELTEQGAGSSSSNLPQLDHMLELARAGAFDVLVVRDPYRLSRELARLLSIEVELQQRGCQIRYGPSDDFATAGMLQAIATPLPAVHRRQHPEKQGRKAENDG